MPDAENGLPNACACGDFYHPRFGPNTDGEPCEWCQDCACSVSDHHAWTDRQGDVWRYGIDGLMHTPETAPFSREYVEKKWGPLHPAARVTSPAKGVTS